jgi:hypothetical protein
MTGRPSKRKRTGENPAGNGVRLEVALLSPQNAVARG